MDNQIALAAAENAVNRALNAHLRALFDISGYDDASEGSRYSAFQELIGALAEAVGADPVVVLALPRRGPFGAPDFQIRRGERIVGYLEVKLPDADLDQVEKTAQLCRYRELPNLILSDGYEFRLYRLGGQEPIKTARLWAPQYGQLVSPSPAQAGSVTELFRTFFEFDAAKPRGARSLAIELARRTRLLQEIVDSLLAGTYPNPPAEKRDELEALFRAFQAQLNLRFTRHEFANLYAQTLTYGLLAARFRCDEPFTRRVAFDGIPPSLGILRQLFRSILLDDSQGPFDWIFDDMVQVLAPVDLPQILAAVAADTGEDPILHFYETFLSVLDPGERKRRGVYYTRRPVVSYIVRSVHLLLERLGLEGGFAHPEAKVLDPAAGTLTFPAEIIRVAAATAKERFGIPPATICGQLLGNVYAFELMMAPYAIGHVKMNLLLSGKDYLRPLAETERFELYLTNTLEDDDEEGGENGVKGRRSKKRRGEDDGQSLLFGVERALARETAEAHRIRDEVPIRAIVGNPPYAGHSANSGRWIRDLLAGYDRPDGRHVPGYDQIDGIPLGEKNPKWLQNDYVKFLRFAQWKIDQVGSGVVGFVTDHGWLANPTFRGLRQSLRGTFETIYVLDLHGNPRLRDAQDPEPDENVFEIRQGVAIALLIKGGKGPRGVFRADLRGRRRDKEAGLASHDVTTTEWTEVTPRGPTFLFHQSNAVTESRFARHWPLPRLFPLHSAGIVTARDAFVLDLDLTTLERRIAHFRDHPLISRGEEERLGLKSTSTFRLEAAREAVRRDPDWRERYQQLLYRPFQLRHVFYADAMIERPRREVMRHLLEPDNLALIVPKQSKGDFGALVAEHPVGHKAVAAFDVNSVFPLFLYPPERQGGNLLDATSPLPNVAKDVLAALGAAHGAAPSPEALLAFVYAILYAPTYRERFREPLSRGFPCIPLPRDRETFARFSALGSRLIDAHLLRSPASGRVRLAGDHPVRLSRNRQECRDYRAAEERVVINSQGHAFTGLSPEVWGYRIGGYRVLDKWLEDRAGRSLKAPEIRDFCQIADALAATIEIEARIDAAYRGAEPDLADDAIEP